MKKRLRNLRDRSLRKMGLVRISALPMRSVTISHHHPLNWGEPLKGPRMTIDATLRNGRRVTGELKEADGPYGYPEKFKQTG